MTLMGYLYRSKLKSTPLIVLLGLGLFVGCASAPGVPDKTKLGPHGVAMREDRDLDWVWTAPGLDFGAFDTLYVTESRADVKDVKPGDAESLEWARGVLRRKLVAELRKRQSFRTVATRESDVPSGARVLQLDTTIVEYRKGDAVLRAFVGVAGQPLVMIQGRMLARGQPVLVFEWRRGGAGVRGGAAFRTNRNLQEADLEDLAEDLADYVMRDGGLR